MRIYSATSEETLRARALLNEWFGDGLLTKPQYELLEHQTVSDLRTTNIFLRLVFFLFTVIIVCAGVALFFVVFLSRPAEQTSGVFFLIFAAVCYAAAEVAVSRARLYRYGIEEALVVCAVGFLCAGLQAVLFGGRPYSTGPHAAQSLVPAAGAVFSLWIWRRFGLAYGFLAAMIFALFLPGYWTSSSSAQHLIVALVYATGLAVVVAVRARHRFDYLDEGYSLVEALLWLGIYAAINLQLSPLNLRPQVWGGIRGSSDFGRPFYWATWVVIWCLPPIVLARGIRHKDRFVIAAGAITAVVTLISNKPYLGWPRHTWDPILLGIVLTAVGVFLQRWFARGPGGMRHGFTAARLSAKDKHWINVGSSVFGLISPHAPTPPTSPDFRFGGGTTGGGGAGGDF